MTDPSATKEASLRRALDYPYERPLTDYIFSNGGTNPLPTDYVPPPSRTAVIACGSNGAPAQLLRKYGDATEIPVLSVTLHGLDVVYGAGVTAYGAVGATLRASEGTETRSFVNLLTVEQLQHMHTTEAGYKFCRLRSGAGVKVTWRGEELRVDLHCYAAPALKLDGGPVALAALPARRRTFPEMDNRQLQGEIQKLMGREGSVDEFILENIASSQIRSDIREKLQRTDTMEECWEVVEDLSKRNESYVIFRK